ncbi:MAG TPA: XRE family transcriptional regulator [Pseudonocardiaceae bacterium]|nr:XRE family transcriptional regulator [Pseudonocardiaceae bacterium]
MIEADPSAPRSLAEKLNWLFETVRRPNGRRHTNKEVAEFCRERTGESFSPEYVSQLRKGQRDNPTKRNLEALSAFFDVTPAYFFDDEKSEQIRAQMDLAAALRDGDVRVVALRDLTNMLRDTAGRMSLNDLQLVTDMVRAIGARRGTDDEQSGDNRR